VSKLVLFRADGSVQDVKLDRERVTIGRRPDNDLCLPQAVVSGEHAVVVTILNDSFLEDLGSTNGTLVNGKAITKHFLRDRDEIDIGREILVYLADDSARIPPPLRRPEPRPADDAKQPAAGGNTSAAAAHEKRRADVPSLSSQSVDAIQRVVAAEIESSAGEEAAEVQPRSRRGAVPRTARRPGGAQPITSGPALRVRSGASAGRSIELRDTETVIGRAGVQVVSVRRSADAILVVPIEGPIPPRINGVPVPPHGQSLAAGDILELAGATLELATPPREDLEP
jgi:hypothetical protein